MRILIADDERLARKRLEDLLEHFPACRLVASCADAPQTLEAIGTYQPDVVFLDIEMPGLNGLEIAARMPSSCRFVFVTAYEEHALKAFDLGAVDYLVKPFENTRFQRCMERQASLMKVNLYRPDLYFDVPYKGAVLKIKASAIYAIKSAGNYIEIATSDQVYLYRATLKSILEQLPQPPFIQIHRQYVVNISYIQHWYYLRRNLQYKFEMANGDILFSARKYQSLIADQIATGILK